jgi:mono/diheme cytochrome c family protein
LEQKINILTGFLLGLLLLASCEDDVGPLILDSTSGPVSYSQDIQRIFDINCIGCHDEFHQQLNLSACCSYDALWTQGASAPYVNPDNPEQSKLYRHLTGDLALMPPFRPLSDYEINQVLQWIREGALEN